MLEDVENIRAWYCEGMAQTQVGSISVIPKKIKRQYLFYLRPLKLESRVILQEWKKIAPLGPTG